MGSFIFSEVFSHSEQEEEKVKSMDRYVISTTKGITHCNLDFRKTPWYLLHSNSIHIPLVMPLRSLGMSCSFWLYGL